MPKISRIMLMMLILNFMLFIELACGYDSVTSSSGYIYHMEQNVEGNGYFSTYQNACTKYLNMSNDVHGSGSYDTDSVLDLRDGVKYDSKNEKYTSTGDKHITLIESADFTYAPINISLGKYSLPIAFKSKGSESTCAKNYVSGVSMNARFSYLDTLSKNLSSELYMKYSTSSTYIDYVKNTSDRTKLNFEAAFSGHGHVGVLDNSGYVHNANILIDEDYRGTYYITKNMSHEDVNTLIRSADEWLPCCSDGFADMNALDKKTFKSATGIFDCTCFKVPTKAEFPRVY